MFSKTVAFSIIIVVIGLCFKKVGFVELGSRRRRRRRREVMAPVVKLAGVNEELQKILEANMDQVPARKRAREAFKGIQLQIDHILFKVSSFFVFLFHWFTLKTGCLLYY